MAVEAIQHSRTLARMLRTTLLLLLGLLPPVLTSGDPIDACGFVTQNGSCKVFTLFSNEYPYDCILPDSVHIDVGAECRVVGTFEECSRSCGYYPPTHCLTEVQLSACIPESLGCGVLHLFDSEYGCYVWRPLGHPQNSLSVEGDGYADGDTVFATGIVTTLYGDICLTGLPVLVQETLSACPDTLTPVTRVTWGRIKSSFH